MSCLSCGSSTPTVVSSCHACNTCSSSGTTSGCDPCPSIVSTPLVLCSPTPGYCTEGCADSLATNCVIYRGPHLGALNLLDGDSVTQALANLNSTLTALIGGSTTVPNFIYRNRCALTEETDVTLITLTKNGVSQLTSSVQFNNGQGVLAYLQTIDPAWVFTAPNIFSIQSPDIWTMSMGCSD